MSETEEPSAEELPELLAARRRKVERLRAEGVDPFPHAFSGVTPIAEVRAAHEGLEPGTETGAKVRVAGRIAARRGQGKAAFVDLVDRSGRIQLLARVNVLGEEGFERLTSLDLGDLIGADGEVIASRTGELTISVEDVTVLAKSLRPPPRSTTVSPTSRPRYRHRELDLIASEESRELFVTRARIISAMRRYLDERGFVEVETPVLQPIYGGAAARPFTTHHNALDARSTCGSHRALPQAPDRRGPGARVRDRQGLPQRGRLAQAQPRVHDAGVVRGPTPTTTTSPGGSRR